MPPLPPNPHGLVDKIYAWRERAQDDGFRPHLGASVIGGPCDRALWFKFRWTTPARFSGRILRLFERGQREEAVFVRELRGIGCEVYEADTDGTQFTVSTLGGHFGGSLDGVARGVPEAPKTWHVVEFKTHGAKSFAKLKTGVEEAKPEHYAQMQTYMHLTGMTRALYLAVNKDTDHLHAERVRYDATAAARIVVRAESIVFANTPPAQISEDPSWWQCRFCDHRDTCHGKKLPPAHCRSCAHSTPERVGDSLWSCAMTRRDIPSVAAQKAGCDAHCFLPCFLARWAEPVDATASGVVYQLRDGSKSFEQGPAGISSANLAAMADPVCAGEPLVQDALDVFEGATVVGRPC